jgi:hypothetical protein
MMIYLSDLGGQVLGVREEVMVEVEIKDGSFRRKSSGYLCRRVEKGSGTIGPMAEGYYIFF